MKRAFLSHRIDFLEADDARANHEKFSRLFEGCGVAIISAAESLDDEGANTDAEIVEKGLTLLRGCDFMIFDCSIENWNYVGCIFEMAYAYQMQKPIVVYTGSTSNNQRPWLRYHATKVVTSHEQLLRAVSELMGHTG